MSKNVVLQGNSGSEKYVQAQSVTSQEPLDGYVFANQPGRFNIVFSDGTQYFIRQKYRVDYYMADCIDGLYRFMQICPLNTNVRLHLDNRELLDIVSGKSSDDLPGWRRLQYMLKSFPHVSLNYIADDDRDEQYGEIRAIFHQVVAYVFVRQRSRTERLLEIVQQNGSMHQYPTPQASSNQHSLLLGLREYLTQYSGDRTVHLLVGNQQIANLSWLPNYKIRPSLRSLYQDVQDLFKAHPKITVSYGFLDRLKKQAVLAKKESASLMDIEEVGETS